MRGAPAGAHGSAGDDGCASGCGGVVGGFHGCNYKPFSTTALQFVVARQPAQGGGQHGSHDAGLRARPSKVSSASSTV